MAEEEVVVARIVGRELQVERYEFRQRSVSTVRCAEGELEEQVRRLRPHLVMWSAPDERGRRLAESLRKTDPGTEWRPGCIELAGWTHLPFSELVRLMCYVGQQEGGWPPGAEDAQEAEAEEALREDLEEIREEEQAISAEAEAVSAEAEAVSAGAEAVSAEAEAVSAEAEAISAEAEAVSAEADAVSAEAEVVSAEAEAVSAEAGAVSGEEPAEQAAQEERGDDLGQRLELVLAVRARRRETGQS